MAFKPTLLLIPLLLTLAWAIDRRWRALLRQGIAAAAAAAIAFVVGCRFLHSWSAWSSWADALPDLEKVSDISVTQANFSLAQLLHEATGLSGGDLSLAMLLLSLVVTTVALDLTRLHPPRTLADRQVWIERDFLVTALGCTLSVVVLKLVWLHYYALTIPLLLYLLRPGAWIAPAANRQPRAVLAMARLIAVLLAFAAVLGRPFDLLVDPSPATRAGLFIGGAWILLLLGLTDLWERSLCSRPAKAPSNP